MLNEKQIDFICKIWNKTYGENLKEDYAGFIKNLKK
jgi:hypothetical protein